MRSLETYRRKFAGKGPAPFSWGDAAPPHDGFVREAASGTIVPIKPSNKLDAIPYYGSVGVPPALP